MFVNPNVNQFPGIIEAPISIDLRVNKSKERQGPSICLA